MLCWAGFLCSDLLCLSWLEKTGGFIIKYNTEVSRGLVEVRLTVIRPTRNQEQPLAKKATSPEREDRKLSVPISRKKWGLERGNMLCEIMQGTKNLCLPRPSLVSLLYVQTFHGKAQSEVSLQPILSANANSSSIRYITIVLLQTTALSPFKHRPWLKQIGKQCSWKHSYWSNNVLWNRCAGKQTCLLLLNVK